MWTENLTTDLEKLRRGELTRGRLAATLLPSLRYLFSTEVHAYAFSIAANAYLSFFPFSLILLVVCRRWLHWEGAYQIVLQLLRIHLPAGADSVIQNLTQLVQGRPRLQLMSVIMLFFTSSGVFLPLEVALNKIWGFTQNRSFLKNQALSFVLAVVSGVVALSTIFAGTGLQWIITSTLGWFPSQGVVAAFSRVVLEVASFPVAVAIFLMIYYFLPNGKVPIAHVWPAALVTGFLTVVGKYVYILTLPMFRFREVYGPFALSVTLLFWAYAGSLILLFGAHLTVQRFVERSVAQAAPVPSGDTAVSPRAEILDSLGDS
jgi:YihY family inner membrane protein